MSKMIVFHQKIISPHMAGLAQALASRGHKVVYAATREMSTSRQSQGWSAPAIEPAQVVLLPNQSAIDGFLDNCPDDAIHICQGIRGNGLVEEVQSGLKRRARKHWVVMETLEERSFKGWLRRAMYRWLFFRWRKYLAGILAIGHATPGWLSRNGYPRNCIFPFAYFLDCASEVSRSKQLGNQRYKIIFVGSLIPRKQLDVLIRSLSKIEADFDLTVIGTGKDQKTLLRLSQTLLKGRSCTWLGSLPMSEAHTFIEESDLLVLPSRFDGWGAVVSEAIILGTPALCSNACGVAGVVALSGEGEVFDGTEADLVEKLQKLIALGPVTAGRRDALRQFGRAITAHEGAVYLEKILFQEQFTSKIVPPWTRNSSKAK